MSGAKGPIRGLPCAPLLEDEAAFRRAIADFEEHRLEKKEADGLGAGEDETGSEAVSGDSLQLIGEPVSMILEQAGKLSADYIVMGSHGHTALHDVIVGSVCAGVLKQADMSGRHRAGTNDAALGLSKTNR